MTEAEIEQAYEEWLADRERALDEALDAAGVQ